MLIWSRDAFISALALSLLHSLWQGTALGAVGFALSARLKRATPDTRYACYSLLLLAIVAVWLATFGMVYGERAYSAPPTIAPSPAQASLTSLLVIAAQPVATVFTLPTLYPFLVALWAVGVCVLSLRHLGGYWVLHRLCRTGSAPCPPEWDACAARLASRLHLRRRFTLRCSAHIDVPCAFGLVRSYVLLPVSALTGLAPQQIEALLAHELAHLARHDVLCNTLQLCGETLLFYHPLVWWLSTQIRDAREQRCDDLVIQVLGDRAVYARALYSLEEARATFSPLAVGAKGTSATMSNTQLVGRIRRILGVASPEKRDPWTKGVLALGAVAIGLLTLVPARAHSRQQTPQTPTVPVATSRVADTMQFQFNVNGDTIELSTLDLKADTPVQVNGKEKRFADLSSAQRKKLRRLMKELPALNANSVMTNSKILFRNNGEEIALNSIDLTQRVILKPDTQVTVNGKAKRFDELTEAQQEQMQRIVKELPATDVSALFAKAVGQVGSATSTTTKIRVNTNGETLEVNTAVLTPDTPVLVNGKSQRFGDLSEEQQHRLKQAVKNTP